MGGFKAHDWRGPRLQGLGRCGLSRRIVEDGSHLNSSKPEKKAEVVEAPDVKAERLPSAEGNQARKSGDFVNQGPKGGRPRTIKGRFASAGATTGSG
jgi:hypothetical protein